MNNLSSSLSTLFCMILATSATLRGENFTNRALKSLQTCAPAVSESFVSLLIFIFNWKIYWVNVGAGAKKCPFHNFLKIKGLQSQQTGDRWWRDSVVN